MFSILTNLRFNKFNLINKHKLYEKKNFLSHFIKNLTYVLFNIILYNTCFASQTPEYPGDYARTFERIIQNEYFLSKMVCEPRNSGGKTFTASATHYSEPVQVEYRRDPGTRTVFENMPLTYQYSARTLDHWSCPKCFRQCLPSDVKIPKVNLSYKFNENKHTHILTIDEAHASKPCSNGLSYYVDKNELRNGSKELDTLITIWQYNSWKETHSWEILLKRIWETARNLDGYQDTRRPYDFDIFGNSNRYMVESSSEIPVRSFIVKVKEQPSNCIIM